jgi:CRP/FNR family transcriptional regulator, cyclic AMP receptor protein
MVAREPRILHPLPLETPVRSGSVVVRQGEPCPPMQVVSRGAFIVEVLRHDGRRLVLDVLGPGDGVGGPGDGVQAPDRAPSPADFDGRFAGRQAQATVRALRPGRLRAAAPGEEIAVLARRAERAARLAADLAWFDVPTWLLARLHVRAGRFGHPVPGGVAIGLRLTHEDLADLCATSRETVTRSIRQLVADERVEVPKRGRIVVRHRLSAVPSCNRITLHEPQ